MADRATVPVGVRLSTDVEYRPDRPTPYRARVRWTDPDSKRRQSLSEGKDSEEEAQEWFQEIIEAAQAALTPSLATMKLAEYGEANMSLALRGLELKTLDPYLAGWRMHLALRMITNGVVDRTVQNWIADEHSRTTVKNTIAVLVRVMEQAVRDGIIKVNPARVTGWQNSTSRPRTNSSILAHWPCPTGKPSSIWPTRSWPPPTTTIAGGETSSSSPHAPPTASARSPDHRGDPPLVAQRILSAGPDPDARLFTGPRGGRISTAVLRDATHWDDVVTKLAYEHLRRHDLRPTGLTRLAKAGVQVHVLRRIAGHGSLTTSQRYLHPDVQKITSAGAALSTHLSVLRAPRSLPSPIVMTR